MFVSQNLGTLIGRVFVPIKRERTGKRVQILLMVKEEFCAT
jgi:hypothetical protein